MTNLLKRASDWLQSQQKQFAAETVVYRRGSASVTLAATIGRTERDVEDLSGMVVRSESRDYLIHAADLVLDGAATLPERGDEIVETTEAGELVYVVLPVDGREVWRYSDPFRTRLRIHTQAKQ